MNRCEVDDVTMLGNQDFFLAKHRHWPVISGLKLSMGNLTAYIGHQSWLRA